MYGVDAPENGSTSIAMTTNIFCYPWAPFLLATIRLSAFIHSHSSDGYIPEMALLA